MSILFDDIQFEPMNRMPRKTSILFKACLSAGLAFVLHMVSFADETISGDRFRKLRTVQWAQLRELVTEFLPDSAGYTVLSSCTSDYMYPDSDHFAMVTVVCPSLSSFESAISVINNPLCPIHLSILGTDTALSEVAPGFRGAITKVATEALADNVYEINHPHNSPDEPTSAFQHELPIQLHTVNQIRWLRWYQRNSVDLSSDITDSFGEYSSAVSDYFYELDTGFSAAIAPTAVSYDLPESLDIYAPMPEYVVKGYQNYKDFLFAHSEINISFATGITAFAPASATLDSIRNDPPREAYPNKERAALQREYREFFERGGNVRSLETLTGDGFDTLQSGEYFFAVGLNETIRFGRELLREEVRRIEEETGDKVARANHAFLFYGEPVLTAGAFWVSEGNPKRIEKVNAQSGHYFYSNLSPAVREDISAHSDRYFKSLAWFFQIIHDLGIPHEGVIMSKM